MDPCQPCYSVAVLPWPKNWQSGWCCSVQVDNPSVLRHQSHVNCWLPVIQRGGYNSESVAAKSCSRIKRWLPLESWVSTVTGWKGPTPPHPSHHSTCGLDKTNILTIHVSEDLSDTRAQCWLYLWQIMYHLAGRECDRTEREINTVIRNWTRFGPRWYWAHTSPLICHRSGAFW